MKKFIVLALCLCFGCRASSQQIVFDARHLAAVSQNGAARSAAESEHNSYLSKISSNVSDINANAGSVVLAQSIVYKALSEVNSGLKDGLMVKNMALMTSDILLYLRGCAGIGSTEPYLLLFASNIEREIQGRSARLVSDVASFILKGGAGNLADYNARDELLKKVTTQLRILDGLAYGAYKTMFWAQQRGIITNLNPYAGWINKDKVYVQRIIASAVYLKKTP